MKIDVTFAMVGTLAWSASGQVHGGDIILGVEGAALVTGTIDPGSGEPAYPWRVFESEFGELGPGFENFTDEPGFDSPAVFTPGTKVGFTIRRALRTWDGDVFAGVPAEVITIAKGGLNASSPPMDVPVVGFVIGEANGGGKFHHHVGYTLEAPHGTGIYLLELEVWSPTLATSDEFWIVFNQNDSEVEHEEAVEWVLANLAGCRPDCEGDADLDLFDFLCFQGRFAVQDPYADFEGDGDLDLFDFLAFQGAFADGC